MKHSPSLPPITDKSFASHFDFLSRHPLVLLGDSSHGTSEFYHARAEITKRLIEHHGFTTVALEADWPDAECIDRYIRDRRIEIESPPLILARLGAYLDASVIECDGGLLSSPRAEKQMKKKNNVIALPTVFRKPSKFHCVSPGVPWRLAECPIVPSSALIAFAQHVVVKCLSS
ncbi:hypothetical protein VE02_08194 [Pseudogymnoascus sp. 03VT05]|nr:hypothetical protein VE02_08194 [Pseudogymnoascus sp. 03VT05]